MKYKCMLISMADINAHKLGFVDMDTEQLSDGIRYTPMRFKRN